MQTPYRDKKPWRPIQRGHAAVVERSLHFGSTEIMSDIPSVVVVPPSEIAGDDGILNECWRYLTGTIREAGIRLETSDSLQPITRGVWPLVVDGTLIALDYSDYTLVPGQNADYKHWFRFQYLASFIPHDNLASFPPISFTDFSVWNRIERRYMATGSQVLHSQSFEFLKDSPTTKDRSLYRRRRDAREKLQAAFPQQLWTAREPQQEFWQRALDCLVSVHIPGSFQHSLDRGQHQLLGLGVCTISPDIWTTLLTERLEPGVHYVRIRDDAADLVDAVHWCENHRDECREIGRNARELFLRNCTPRAIWRHVKHHIDRYSEPVE